ncbi:MAG: AAA family ATPase [Firmicutes bacterium]|jgi:type II secretory pathway predicted ATPase ExeA|nr:AAA family ATPase [Bacillota bacterium]
MIQRYFGLKSLPFDRALPPADLYVSQGWQELSARLDYIVRSRALGVITGEIGAGKSTAIRALAARLDPVRHPFLYIADSGLEPGGFYREVLAQFGITPAFHRRDTRRQFSHAFLDAYENQGKQPVLVVDEAHLLSPSMMAEVRFIVNFRFDSLSPFALILVGQPELRATLRLRTFEVIRQRVGVRYHLSGLQEPETKAYIEHSLKYAGATRPLFTDAAISQIHTITRGIPRLINTLATACLLDVCSQGGQVADTENVQRAQLDYEQI